MKLKLIKNLGLLDRFVRVSFALLILYLFMNNAIFGSIGYVGIVIAAVLFLTGLLGMCPIYSAMGIASDRYKK